MEDKTRYNKKEGTRAKETALGWVRVPASAVRGVLAQYDPISAALARAVGGFFGTSWNGFATLYTPARYTCVGILCTGGISADVCRSPLAPDEVVFILHESM